MAKSKNIKKQGKKQPKMTAKEKKAAKRLKKSGNKGKDDLYT